jgi:hypothetical protein
VGPSRFFIDKKNQITTQLIIITELITWWITRCFLYKRWQNANPLPPHWGPPSSIIIYFIFPLLPKWNNFLLLKKELVCFLFFNFHSRAFFVAATNVSYLSPLARSHRPTVPSSSCSSDKTVKQLQFKLIPNPSAYEKLPGTPLNCARWSCTLNANRRWGHHTTFYKTTFDQT